MSIEAVIFVPLPVTRRPEDHERALPSVRGTSFCAERLIGRFWKEEESERRRDGFSSLVPI